MRKWGGRLAPHAPIFSYERSRPVTYGAVLPGALEALSAHLPWIRRAGTLIHGYHLRDHKILGREELTVHPPCGILSVALAGLCFFSSLTPGGASLARGYYLSAAAAAARALPRSPELLLVELCPGGRSCCLWSSAPEPGAAACGALPWRPELLLVELCPGGRSCCLWSSAPEPGAAAGGALPWRPELLFVELCPGRAVRQ